MSAANPTHAKTGLAYGFFRAEKATQARRPGGPAEPVTRVRIARAFAILKADPELKVDRGLDLRVSLLYISDGRMLFFRRAEPPVEMFGVSDADNLLPLTFITYRMGMKGANWIVKASLAEADNEKTAYALGHAFNMLYSCAPMLVVVENNSKGEPTPVAMDVFFKNGNGIYVSRLEVDKF